MSKPYKTIVNLVFIILILIVIVNAIIFIFGLVWLQTYKAFTAKTFVAEIAVSPLAVEADGRNSFEVTYRQVKSLPAIGANDVKTDVEFQKPMTFKMIGDEFRIGGQIIKFQDLLTILGIKTVFKITRLESSFLDGSNEGKYGRTVIDLNGGVDNVFKFVQENEGGLLSIFVDTAMGDYPGKNAPILESTIYDLYVTEEGFLLTLKN